MFQLLLVLYAFFLNQLMLKSLMMKFFNLIELLKAFIKWKMISRVKRAVKIFTNVSMDMRERGGSTA
jgi:hypothetical protein